jgi:hypothetical protein
MHSNWKLTAHLFAASFIEVCPDVVLQDIWAGHFGFYINYSLSFPLTDEFMKIIEERMREKIRSNSFSAVFEMSTRNVIECLKGMKQFTLARNLDRSEPGYFIVKIGEYIGVIDEEIDPNLKKIGNLFFERGAGTIHGIEFSDKDELKRFRKALKEREKNDHVAIGAAENFFKVDESDVYWLPKGVAFRKRLEKKIEDFLQAAGYEEVEFSGTIEWYRKKGLTKIFTTLEDEEESRYECGLKDHSLQKIYYVADSSLQFFENFDKIISLNFEFQDSAIQCADIYGIFWKVIWQEGTGIKISIDRIAAMLVEKRDFLVC